MIMNDKIPREHGAQGFRDRLGLYDYLMICMMVSRWWVLGTSSATFQVCSFYESKKYSKYADNLVPVS